MTLRFAMLLLVAAGAAAFQAAPSTIRTSQQHSSSPLILMKKGGKSGKGFGAAPPAAPAPAKKSKKKPNFATAVPPSAPMAPGLSAAGTEMINAASELVNAENRGKQMLEDMRKEAGAPVSKKPKLILTEEEEREMDPTEGVMPEVVADRMLKRIIPFAAGPLVLSVFIFIGFYIANTQLQMDLPPQIVAYATQACLLLSFAGITWGVMSTNLEEDGDQSALGVENIDKNINVMRGAEDDRIMATKREVEEEEALRDGILLSRSAQKKRDKS